MARKILVVDDETVLLETIAYNLTQSGYQVMIASNGIDALKVAQQDTPDLVLLDLMLPGIDGLEVCRRLRRADATATTPIIMLTAHSDEIDKVVGLEVGADDYITKPFGRSELLARVRALLRRANYTINEEQRQDNHGSQQYKEPQAPRRHELVAGALRIDEAGRQVSMQGKYIDFQPKQFDLLTYFVQNRGTVLTRDQLLQHVWGYDYVGDTRTIDVHVRWLREKLEEDPANPKLLQTVRGRRLCVSRRAEIVKAPNGACFRKSSENRQKTSRKSSCRFRFSQRFQ